MMKAWLVWHKEDDEHREIVHALNRSRAIAGSAAYSDSREWTKMVAKRAPEFDDKPLNDKTYIENGWFVYCNGPRCEHTIEEYHFEYEEDGYKACWDESGEYAYCSEKCRRAVQTRNES